MVNYFIQPSTLNHDILVWEIITFIHHILRIFGAHRQPLLVGDVTRLVDIVFAKRELQLFVRVIVKRRPQLTAAAVRCAHITTSLHRPDDTRRC